MWWGLLWDPESELHREGAVQEALGKLGRTLQVSIHITDRSDRKLFNTRHPPPVTSLFKNQESVSECQNDGYANVPGSI